MHKSDFTHELNLNFQLTNKSKFLTLLSKYDTRKIRMELQRIHLISELDIFLTAYRTFPKEKLEIK